MTRQPAGLQQRRCRLRPCAERLSPTCSEPPPAPCALHPPADPAKTLDITSARKATVEFTYSVAWRETDIPYERRMDK